MKNKKPKIFVTLKDIYRYANKHKTDKINIQSVSECLIALTLREKFGIEVNTRYQTNNEYGWYWDAPVVDSKTKEIVFKSKSFNTMHMACFAVNNSEKTGKELCALLCKYSGKSHKYFMS
jgi:hypothetical protein